jgi:hypothetical protein
MMLPSYTPHEQTLVGLLTAFKLSDNAEAVSGWEPKGEQARTVPSLIRRGNRADDQFLDIRREQGLRPNRAKERTPSGGIRRRMQQGQVEFL